MAIYVIWCRRHERDTGEPIDPHTRRLFAAGMAVLFVASEWPLHDLAEHKHMSVNSCLEEILLHTNEPLGDGVASPHTKKTINYIQELKKKHGIDYDSHASYRFVEE